MNNDNSLEQLNTALLDVRKAYRLLYTYQSRVLDIMEYIKHQTGRNYEGGWAKFSAPSPRNGSGKLTDSAWNWLSMYCYEFWFGSVSGVQLSVWIVSDTGYFDIDYSKKEDVTTFAECDASKTKLVFVIGKDVWHTDMQLNNKRPGIEQYLKKQIEQEECVENFNDEYKKGILIIKSFDLVQFSNENDAYSALSQVAGFCKEKDINEFILKPRTD